MSDKARENLIIAFFLIGFAVSGYWLRWLWNGKAVYVDDFDLSGPATTCQYRGCKNPAVKTSEVTAETGQLDSQYKGVKRTIIVHVREFPCALCAKHLECLEAHRWPQHGWSLAGGIVWWLWWSACGGVIFAFSGIIVGAKLAPHPQQTSA